MGTQTKTLQGEATTMIEAAFVWTCPICQKDQMERVTAEGPHNSLECFYCGNEVHPGSITPEEFSDWQRALADIGCAAS